MIIITLIRVTNYLLLNLHKLSVNILLIAVYELSSFSAKFLAWNSNVKELPSSKTQGHLEKLCFFHGQVSLNSLVT